MHSLYTHYALTMHSLSKVKGMSYALTVHSLCTHYALTMHSLCTHYALTKVKGMSWFGRYQKLTNKNGR
jgi:hypothetical protein